MKACLLSLLIRLIDEDKLSINGYAGASGGLYMTDMILFLVFFVFSSSSIKMDS